MLHDIRWTRKKIGKMVAELRDLRYQSMIPIAPFRYLSLPGPQLPAPVGYDVDDSGWVVIHPDTLWGERNTNFVLRSSFTIPTDWSNGQPIYLFLPLGIAGDFSHPEALIYIDGEPFAACDRHHQEVLLPPRFHDGQTHLLALHGWPGAGSERDINKRYIQLQMKTCSLVQLNSALMEFLRIVDISLRVVDILPDQDLTRQRLLNAMDKAYNTLDLCKPFGREFDMSLNAAVEELMDGISAAGSSLDVEITASGHAHLDVGWLWQVDQGRRKAGRTFTTALRLLEEFPDYLYAQSQPQLYQFIEQDYPAIFQQVKQAIRAGRWEVLGGMWVEPDTNSVGSESLARQLLLGRRYYREHFGDVESPILFLPDSFGYSGALPQLARLAGLKYFIAQKMSWNQYDRMPFQSFWWQGIDGTQILTHFLTTPGEPVTDKTITTILDTSSYNAMLNPQEVMGTWQNFDQKETHQNLLMLYGYGDGGGGPSREMLQNLSLMQNFPGLPRVRSGTIGGFMSRLEREASANLPQWSGELYLEFHRGTLTSQARTKRANRKNEIRLHNAEFLASLASLHGNMTYPHTTLKKAWELLCCNQFHDILPGSSIAKVYEDTLNDHAKIQETAQNIIGEAVESLAEKLDAQASHVVINPTPFSGSRTVIYEGTLENGKAFFDLETGEDVPVQMVENGTLMQLPSVAPYSVSVLGVRDADQIVTAGVHVEQTPEGFVLENDVLRVELSGLGEILRLWDKEFQREVIPAGQPANVLQAFEDRPVEYDAWDIEIYYEDKCWPVELMTDACVLEEGPLRCGVMFTRKFRSSRIVQKVYLSANSRRIDFDTQIDWHEQQVLLKAAFPVEILSPTATYDIQWGSVERPTHRNTSWDWARFESAAHKWVDLSEGDYGVSLLNDCKYGHDVHENVIRITLLKSATMPDPFADQGEHRFTYSLYPHPGNWRTSTVQAAYDLNNPLQVLSLSAHSGTAKKFPALVRSDRENVVIETVKQAEDGQGIIVRLYENQRSRGTAKLSCGFSLKRAFVTNLLEENQQELETDDSSVSISFKPFEIITLRLIGS